MKRREIKELHLKSQVELQTLLEKTEKELTRLRMEMSTGKVKDRHGLARKRDDIARIKTLKRKRVEENEKI